jgi:hypothetical protein
LTLSTSRRRNIWSQHNGWAYADAHVRVYAGTSTPQLPAGKAQRALALIGERYADFGPTLAGEKLRECRGLVLSKETVRHLMKDAGLWVPRKQRSPKIHQPRARRECFVELIQVDVSDHRWFEERTAVLRKATAGRGMHVVSPTRTRVFASDTP